MNIDLVKQYRQLKDSTIKLYEAKAKKIAEHLEINMLIPIIIKEQEKELLEWIGTQNHHEQKLLINILLLVLSPQKNNPIKNNKRIYNRFNKLLKETHDEYLEEKKSGIKNEKEITNWMEWDEVKERLSQLKEDYEETNNKKEFLKYMLLSLYVHHPPRRLEYGLCKIIKESDYNKLRLNNKQNAVYLVRKKTGSKHSLYFSFGANMVKVKKYNVAQLINVKKELEQVLFRWIEMNPSDYLFPNRSGEKHIQQSQFSKTLSKIFSPKKISSNMLRKIFLSDWNKIPRTWQQRELLADLMNHSAVVAMSVYTKI